MDNIDKDRLGVSKISTQFALMGWTLRERMLIDYGIDADVEQKENSKGLFLRLMNTEHC
jgi:hypothetical protein